MTVKFIFEENIKSVQYETNHFPSLKNHTKLSIIKKRILLN